MLDASQPFVLLDAAGGGTARLYRAPEGVIAARCGDIAQGMAQLDQARVRGRHLAGFVTYPGCLAIGGMAAPPDAPGMWFGSFADVSQLPAEAVPALLGDPAGAWTGALRPRIERAAYLRAFDAVAEWIRAGDIYQANLSFQAELPVGGSPLALYAALRPQAGAGHGALVWTGAEWLLSFSPELFFELRDGRVRARPMKGTAERLPDPVADAAAAAALAADPKQRAENLMILDLMRNDLSRIAQAGSVAVPDRFRVETYPTVHQLVSEVTATLAPPCGVGDVLRALSPCGSITGAPKRRATEIIAAVEPESRGVYTGTIGRIDPDGSAAFNVAIRTLTLAGERPDRATLGLGSGIVADSNGSAEWRECLAKGRFLHLPPRFDLIETMLFDPDAGVVLLERHLDRMAGSASALGFAFDRHAARNALQAATFRLDRRKRLRLLLGHGGALAIEAAPPPPTPADPVTVALASLPVPPSDFRLRHKTSERGFYDRARQAAGCFEVAFVDPDGMLTEGSFTSLFVPRGDRLATPPLARGLLPGVLRAELIATGRAVEVDLTPDDLAGGFFVGNALRGLIPAVAAARTPAL